MLLMRGQEMTEGSTIALLGSVGLAHDARSVIHT